MHKILKRIKHYFNYKAGYLTISLTIEQAEDVLRLIENYGERIHLYRHDLSHDFYHEVFAFRHNISTNNSFELKIESVEAFTNMIFEDLSRKESTGHGQLHRTRDLNLLKEIKGTIFNLYKREHPTTNVS